ncbi:hypothetical protein M407DRAFT_18907 [Tulasnella calospora MUT 4182]|uniref:Uncharacterized protein n=1 Tax=Tulasnella calospora MUT 4182 TaxID=1051891 RepID=A0A0C3LDS0_9AGAM|nr:hypothetical protein M407DRAFT_18907 [Tulasnella calospora MUT 4182]
MTAEEPTHEAVSANLDIEGDEAAEGFTLALDGLWRDMDSSIPLSKSFHRFSQYKLLTERNDLRGLGSQDFANGLFDVDLVMCFHSYATRIRTFAYRINDSRPRKQERLPFTSSFGTSRAAVPARSVLRAKHPGA